MKWIALWLYTMGCSVTSYAIDGRPALSSPLKAAVVLAWPIVVTASPIIAPFLPDTPTD